jgi:hypothetical protein
MTLGVEWIEVSERGKEGQGPSMRGIERQEDKAC